jgi:hypothetical protein
MGRKKRKRIRRKPPERPNAGPKRSDIFKERAALAREGKEGKFGHVKQFSPLALLVLAGGLLLGVGALAAFSAEAPLPLRIVLVVAAGGCILFGGFQLFMEARIPRLPARDAEEAMTLFLRALTARRWDMARAVLSHVAGVPTERPDLGEMGLEGGRFDLGTDAGLEAYWKHLCGTPIKRMPPTTLSFTFSLSGERTLEEGLVSAICVLRISRTEQRGKSATVTTWSYTGTLVAYERSGAWRLLYGGLPEFARVMLSH